MERESGGQRCGGGGHLAKWVWENSDRGRGTCLLTSSRLSANAHDGANFRSVSSPGVWPFCPFPLPFLTLRPIFFSILSPPVLHWTQQGSWCDEWTNHMLAYEE